MKKPKIDVIIPTYNNLEELKHCLSHFEKQTEKNFRILVCVDGSTDGTLEWLHNYSKTTPLNIVVLTHPDNKHHGKEKTRNLTLGKIVAPYILFFDSDLYPTEKLVEEHLKIVNKDTISVGSIFYTNYKENLWAYFSNYRGVEKYKHLEEIPYIYFHTGNSAMPSQFFISVNGQYENFTGYGGDDSELIFRINKKYSPKFIANKKALALSSMNKTLTQALNQYYLFGNTNLKIISKLHPEEENFYKLKWLKHKGFVGKIFPIIMNPIFAKIMEFVIKLPLPNSWKLKPVKFLAIYNIYKGFSKK